MQRALVEVDVDPAQRDELADADARVEEDAEGVGVLAVLGDPRRALLLPHALGLAMAAGLADAREGLDLLDLVVVERGRWRLAALVGAVDRIAIKLERVAAAGVLEHRVQDLAVLVDVARRKPGVVELAQERAHVRGRDLRDQRVTERLHGPPRAATVPAGMGLSGFAQQRPVVAQRRGLDPADPLEPMQPVVGEATERRRALLGQACVLGRVDRLVDLALHRLASGEQCRALVEPPLTAAAAALAPAADIVRLEPRQAEPALLQCPGSIRPDPEAPLRIPVNPVAGSGPRPQHEAPLLDLGRFHTASLNQDLRLGITFLRAGHQLRLGISLGIKQANLPVPSDDPTTRNRPY